jgi:hypothetical protein
MNKLGCIYELSNSRAVFVPVLYYYCTHKMGYILGIMPSIRLILTLHSEVNNLHDPHDIHPTNQGFRGTSVRKPLLF